MRRLFFSKAGDFLSTLTFRMEAGTRLPLAHKRYTGNHVAALAAGNPPSIRRRLRLPKLPRGLCAAAPGRAKSHFGFFRPAVFANRFARFAASAARSIASIRIPRADAAINEIMTQYEKQTGRKPDAVLASSPGAWHAGTVLTKAES